MIPFNKPYYSGNEVKFIQQVVESGSYSGNGDFTNKCQTFVESYTGAHKALLTPSCTHALELAALILDIQPEDEVIVPSFTFVSSVNPFVLRGAKIVFVDIDPNTLTIDVDEVKKAITTKTKVIVPVHYAGVSCDMDALMKLANENAIFVVEDAAQGIGSFYNGKHLGTIGHLGCISFHETKNIQCGEGGVLLLNDTSLIEKALIIREKGTDRERFLQGRVDKYTWIDKGSSYLTNEITAAFLYAQLFDINKVNTKRKQICCSYSDGLSKLRQTGKINFNPDIGAMGNGHIFHIQTLTETVRKNLTFFLSENDIDVRKHYLPLHISAMGKKFRAVGSMKNTINTANNILRLPMYFKLNDSQCKKVIDLICTFY